MKDDSLLLDYRALALRSAFSTDYLSEIITTHGTYYSKMSPIELLEEACLRHHSSKRGRKEAAKKLLKFHKKPPFLISDDVAVFPTMSSIHPECTWIFSHFFEEELIAKEETKIKFHDGTEVIVPVSLYTVQQQKLKVLALLSHVQQSKRKYIPEYPLFGMNPNPPMQQM
ncbi:competence protein ComK [Sporosarcina sp. Marseille-Q4943]|uniref:competence protein ComK n=1 Tax=Sporosarcina sp. Marseille-Q4943 TaxID=2942204 RepID=UPI00208DB1D1|nr:competence protein ComK [Sporosarcina sp. Marseille-Q4943]